MRKRYILLSIFLFAGFIFFSYLVSRQYFTQFDLGLTIKLQNIIPRFWDSPFSIFSLLGSAEITGLIWLGLVVWAISKRLWITLGALSLLVAAQIIGVLGKLWLFHPGPSYTFYRGISLLPFFPSRFIELDFSYPSGHSMRVTFLVLFLFSLASLKLKGRARLAAQAGLVAFLLLMLVSRVYLGEHWISDVIGGVLLGSSFGIVSGLTLTKMSQASRQQQAG